VLMAGLLLLFVLPMPVAQAHATLISSIPAVSARLSALPSYVEVTFDDNLLVLGSAKSNVLQVLDPQGKEIDAGNSKVTGSRIRVDVKDPGVQGVFTVSWRVVSGDGHPVESSYQFSVGSVGSALPSPSRSGLSSPQLEKNFWKAHQQEFYLGIAALLFLGIWASFERRRRALGKK